MATGKFSKPRNREEDRQIEQAFRQVPGQEAAPQPKPTPAPNPDAEFLDLIPELDALENVTLPLIYQGIAVWEREDMARDALRRVGMEDRAHHRPSEMSGGQQQRVAIARAIATHPPIIMADEPTGALDSKTGQHVLEILRTLCLGGTTILLITHDEGIAATARRVVRLSDGKIISDSRQEVSWV